jgi:hypothetical protein
MSHTWRLVGFGGLLAAILAFTSSDLHGQKKNKKDKAPDPGYPATDAEYAQIKNVKDLTGTLLSIDMSGRMLTIRVEIPHQEPNPNYKPRAPKVPKVGSPGYQQANFEYQQYRLYQDIMKQQQILSSAKTPQQRQNAMMKLQLDMMKYQQQMAQVMARSGATTPIYPGGDPNNPPFVTVTSIKDYTLDYKENVNVRKMFLPMEYDDMGNIKKYTDKEKEELRGKDKSKPGYEAKLEDLLPTQEIKIYLTPPKPKKKEVAKKDVKDAKDKDAKDKDAKDKNAKDKDGKEKDAKDEDGADAKDKGAKGKDKDAKDAKADEPLSPPVENFPDRPMITMIVMTKELPVASVSPDNTPKKKKKNN